MLPYSCSTSSPQSGANPPVVTPRYKVYQAKGDWYVARKQTEGWLTISGPYTSEHAANRALPCEQPQ